MTINPRRNLYPRIVASATVLALLICSSPHASAQAPDLTAGDTRTDNTWWNLGPTGMKGWFYRSSGTHTWNSRQIQVTLVEAGSPAAGLFEVDDVILGANGTGADPVNFGGDARYSLAAAIADAEARSPATLKLLRWRAGVTTIVPVQLETLGAYSATAPYNCPKSAAILEKGLNAIMNHSGNTDGMKFSAMTLLAANNPANPNNSARQARARTEARSLILDQATINEYTSGIAVRRNYKLAWALGHELITLAEYYLQTGDADVLPSIRARALAYAYGQSMFGTVGHQLSLNGPSGGYGVGYGVVNSAGVPCFYGLILAQKCGLTDPEIAIGIQRAGQFYAAYVNRGSIPYGEHQPGGGHESNGKMGLAALAFNVAGTRPDAVEFFTKMATVGGRDRDIGHTGSFFCYLWSALGANAGGEEAMATYFNYAKAMYDLARRWDGRFEYDDYTSKSVGSQSFTWSSNKFEMSTAMLLTYALPLRQTYTTGRNQDPQKWLSAQEIAAVKNLAIYNAASRSTAQLLEDLGGWSPPARNWAADELKVRTSEHATFLPTLHANAADTQAPLRTRLGAVVALDSLAKAESVPLLVTLLTDSENLIRWAAAGALRAQPHAAKAAHLNALLAATASTAKPILPIDPEDPIHLAHENLAMLVFGNQGLFYNLPTLDGIDRNLLYPAVRAVLKHPRGAARAGVGTNVFPKMSKADVEAVAGSMIDATIAEPPSDRMSSGPENSVVNTFQKFNFAEGVPLAKSLSSFTELAALNSLEAYAGSSLTVVPDPQIVDFCKLLTEDPESAAQAQEVLNAIAADQFPEKAIPFKNINWILPDAPTLTLPANRTVLRVYANDFAEGTPVYHWRKVHGAGDVSFIPNGTEAAKNATVVFNGAPGIYQFEVTMSDSRGLTEVSKTVMVTLRDSAGNLPANTAPTANPQTVPVTAGAPTQIVLTGTDPEGKPLVYTVSVPPAKGVLSGTAPNLLYSPNIGYTGADSFTFVAMDSEGQTSSAVVAITVSTGAAHGLAVYEPFDYPAGPFNGRSGSNEVGLAGAWTADSSIQLIANSLPFGSLVTKGGSIGNLNSSKTFVGSRPISPAALGGNHLLDDGATLWFSAVMGGASTYNTRMVVALANNRFLSNTVNITNDGALMGSGIGMMIFNDIAIATELRDTSFGNGEESWRTGAWTGDGAITPANTHRLVVGKITWGANLDRIDLYQPKSDLRLPASASSWITANVNQTTFDTLTLHRSGEMVLDEVRFGATYESVVQGTVAMTPDVLPPTPDPPGFAVAPYPNGASSIKMVAGSAYDASGVEYQFTCTAGGGPNSSWQTGTTYTATGLTPGVTYSYTVKARDTSPAGNEGQPSAPASATIPALAIVPDLAGTLQSTAEAMIANAGLIVGTVTNSSQYSSTVPAGHVLSQTPNAASTSVYGTAVDLVISIGADPANPSLLPVNIVDNKAGAAVQTNLPVTYTITFSEDMNAATVDAADFTNLGTSAITIGAITETSPGVFTVVVTPTSTGYLRFAIAAGAQLTDAGGAAMDTGIATMDDTTLTINLPSVTVPNVINTLQTSAQTTLINANLTVGTITSVHDETILAGRVVFQNPAAGSSFPGQTPVDLAISIGPPPDTRSPVILHRFPANAAINVSVSDNIKLYFNEQIAANTGNVYLVNLTDYTETVIPITDSAQVNISSGVLAINPAQNLLPAKTYAVRFTPGAVKDLAGNLFSALPNNEAWNFSTWVTPQETILFTENFESPNVTAYTQGSTPPSWVRATVGFAGTATWHGLTDKAGGDFSAAAPNNQAYALRNDSTGITTNEGLLGRLAAGVTYKVEFDTIRDNTLGATDLQWTVQLFGFVPSAARNDCRFTGSGTFVGGAFLGGDNFNGNATDNGLFSPASCQYTVQPGSPEINHDFALRFRGASPLIDNVVVKTINPNAPDSVPPAVTRFTPLNNTASFPVENNVVLNFNENITLGYGFITLKNLTDGTQTHISVLDANQVFLNDKQLTINPTFDLLEDKFYAIHIAPTAIYDLAGNAFPGIQDDARWRIYTGVITDSTAPSIVTLSPADESTGVSHNGDLTVTFDEAVALHAGNVTIKNLTNGSQLTIAAADASQVSLAGRVLTINPAVHLGEGENHAVRMDAGLIRDLAGNAFDGISDDSTWNFTTSAANPPQITSLTPADNTVNIAIDSNLVVTFNEDVMAGSGDITLKNLSNGSQSIITVTDASQVSINGPVVTINPGADLLEGKAYAIRIASGAISDLQGNGFSGITNDTAWTFITRTSSFGSVFTEDFETTSGSPDVTAIGSMGATSKNTGPKWIRAASSDQHGIVDESSGQFSDGSGQQAYAFRAGNTGITTIPSLIGPLIAGKTYTVSFHVVKDGYNEGGAYNAALVTFASGATRTSLTSISTSTSKLLTQVNSTYSGTNYDLVTFQYTASAVSDAAVLGHDVALRLRGGGTSAIIDDVRINVTGGDMTAPALAGTDIVDARGGAPMAVNTSVNFTVNFSEDIDHTTVTTADFGNAGTSAISIGSITETAPGVFTIAVTPTTVGTLRLRVIAGAVIRDVSYNALNTTAAITDDTVITVAVPMETVPNVVGLAQATAEANIVAANLVVGTITTNYHPTIPQGSVISQSPIGGANVATNDIVDLVVSSGPLVLTTSFDATGGTPAVPASIGVSYGSAYGTLPTTSYLGYNFIGWFTAATGGNLVTSDTLVSSTENHTLYAHWEVDTTPPVLVSLSPLDDEANASASGNLVITFNESVAFGTGSITIRKSATGSTVETFNVANPPANLTINGAAVTINPTLSLENLTAYFVQIDATAIKDLTGNAFPGIADATTWNFSTFNQSLVLLRDNFDTADNTNISTNIATRQTGTMAPSGYTEASGDSAISNARLNVASSAYAINNADFKSALTAPGVLNFTMSLDLANTGTSWVSPYLSTHTGTDDRSASRFGMLLFQNGSSTVLSAYGNSGTAQSSTSLTKATLESLLGYTFNANQSNTYTFVATPTSTTAGTYDLFINGVEALSNIPYLLGTGGGNGQINWENRNISGGVASLDNLLICRTLNSAPTWISNPFAAAAATAGSAYSASIASAATDVNDQPLNFAKVSGPTWLSVATNGTLTGVPGYNDPALSTFIVSVSDGMATPVQATLNITVINGNNLPTWGSNPLAKADATEDTAYSASLASDASDPDAGATLTFSKVSGPAWLSVAANGTLSGTPENNAVGANSFTVSVSDGLAPPVQATLNVTVINTNDIPVWSANPLSKANANEGSAYSGTLATDAVDADAGTTLAFAKISGPSWLSVAADGALSGTPANSDLGANSFTLSVSDGIAPAVETTVNITVLPANVAPAFTANPIIAANANEDAAYAATLAGSATDANGDTLAYAKVSGPSWLLVAANGALTGTPGNSAVGANVFTVSVSDGIAAPVQATLNITVIAKPTSLLLFSDNFTAASGTSLTTPGARASGTLASSVAYAWTSTTGVVVDGMLNWDNNNSRNSNNEQTDATGTENMRVNFNWGPHVSGKVWEVEFDQRVAWSQPLTFGLSDTSQNGVWSSWDNSAYDFAAGAYGTALRHDTDNEGGANGLAVTSVFPASPNSVNTHHFRIRFDEPAQRVRVWINGVLRAESNALDFESTGRYLSWGEPGNYAGALDNLSVKLINANSPPVFAANPIIGSAATEDAAYTATLTGSASDVDGETLTYAKVSGPAWLGVAANGALSGTPSNSDLGENTFTVSVSDGIAAPVEATLNITVINTNDVPTWASNPITGTNATEDAAYSGSIAGSASDADAGASLTYSKVDGPAWLTVGSDGTLSGTPTNSDVGTNNFIVSVSDGIAAAVEATLEITVLNENDAPVWTTSPVAKADATEDASYSATLAGDASDMDAGATLTFAKVGGPAWLLVAANGALSGTPANGDVGANNFIVSVSDGMAAAVETTLIITVTNTNDAPTWAGNPVNGSDATEDAAYSGTLAGSASDVDAGATLTYVKISGPAWLSVAANGALTGTPANGDVGANTFTISVSDGIAPTVEAMLNITVINTNDVPTWASNPITGTNATEDAAYSGSIAGSASDADAGTTLIFSKVNGPAWLTVGSDGTLSGTPANSDVGTNNFTVSVSDGIAAAVEATLEITVLNENDAPVWTTSPVAKADATEDASYSATLASDASDVDAGATLTFAKISGPSWLSIAADGTLSGTPQNSDVGTNSFTVSVNDGIAAAVEATLEVTVLNENDAPVWATSPVAKADATEDASYSATLAGDASDVDAETTLTFTKISGPDWLLVAADGTLSGTPSNGDVGANNFIVSVSDGMAAAVETNLTITVTNTNDAPVWASNPLSGLNATEDAFYSATLASDASDADVDATLTFAKVSGPSWLSVAANGALTGTPSFSNVGTNTFTVQVSDGIAAPVETQLNIQVAAGFTRLLLFKDDFNPANGTSLTNPASRATGTLAASVKYAWTSSTGVAIDGKLNWDNNNTRDTNNEQTDAGGAQNLRMNFNWAPHVAGMVWEVEFNQRVGWSHPLTFALSDTSQNGVWNAWDTTSYDFATGSYGTSLRHDTENEGGANGLNVTGVFPAVPNTVDMHHFRIRFDEPAARIRVWINGVLRAESTALDFESTGRYLSWGEPINYAGALDNLTVNVLTTNNPLALANYLYEPIHELDPADQDFTADPDMDGLPNGLEVWFGTHPGQPNAGLAVQAADGHTITFTHPRNENAPANVNGFYQWSPNLKDWYDGDGVAGPPEGPTANITSASSGATTTVTATMSVPTGRVFLRAGALQN